MNPPITVHSITFTNNREERDTQLFTYTHEDPHLTTTNTFSSPETPPTPALHNLPTQQFARLSTAHITRKDANLLDKNAHNPSSPVMPWSSKYGHLIFIPDDIETIRNNEDWPFSDDFWNTLTYINDCGINYILFDRDAEIIPGLPTHSW